MKKYYINLSDKNLLKSITSNIDKASIVENQEEASTVITDETVNSFFANIFNRSNGILVIGTYGKNTTFSAINELLIQAHINPFTINLGKDKKINLNGEGFCLLNPGMNLELIEQLKPSIVILTGIIDGIKNIDIQAAIYEKAIQNASVGIVINDDCSEASIFKYINANTLVYSMRKKADILCKNIERKDFKTDITINKDTYTINGTSKDNIAATMASIGVSELLGFNKEATTKSISKHIPPFTTLYPIRTINNITIINDNSIYPEQIEKNIKNLSNYNKRVIFIFSPNKDFYSDKYEHIFSSLPITTEIAICGDGINDKKYENLTKKLKKEMMQANFFPSRRDTIKHIIARANPSDIIVLMGHMGSDFNDFCNNIWISLESKSI